MKIQTLVSSLFFGLVLVFISFGTKAQAIVFQKDLMYNLFDTTIDVFIDRSGSMSVTDVIKSNQFMKKKCERHRKELNTLWVRFIVQNNTDYNICFNNVDPNIENITFYLKLGAKWDSNTIDNSKKFADRRYRVHNKIFDLNIGRFRTDTVYIKYFSTHNFIYKGWISTTASYFNYVDDTFFDHRFYSGIVFVLIFYGFFMLLLVKRIVYLYFSMFSLASLLFYFSRHGIDFKLIYPSYPSFVPNATLFFSAFLVVWQYFYVMYFIQKSTKKSKNQQLIFISTVLVIVGYTLYCAFVLNDLKKIPNLLFLPCLYFSILCWYDYLNYKKISLFVVIGATLNFLGITFETLQGDGYLTFSLFIDPFVLKYILILDILLFLLATIQYFKSVQNQTESLALELNKLIAQPDKIGFENLKEFGTWGPVLEVDNTVEKISKSFLDLKIDNSNLQQQLIFLAKNKILQNEISYSEFKILFQDENVALSFLSDLKWKAGYTCKRCGSSHFKISKESFDRKCTACLYNESPKVSSVYEGIKIPLYKAYYLTYYFQQHPVDKLNFSVLSAELDIRRQTISDFILKLKEKQQAKDLDKHWTVLIF